TSALLDALATRTTWGLPKVYSGFLGPSRTAEAGHHAGQWAEITPRTPGGHMAAQVGVGLVGSGFIAEMHAEAFALSTIASVRAVASRTPDRAAASAGQHGIPAWHSDFRELVERSDVDLVCIAAPNHLHRDITVAAAEAGKHVICEKPLARTLAEADEMIAAC